MNLTDTKLHERNGTRRHKRAVYVPRPIAARGRRWPELPTNPCNDSHNSEKTTSELYVCYNSTRFISTVVIPMSSFTIGGCKGSKWKGYVFYLNAQQDKTTKGDRAYGWGQVFAYTGKDWSTGSYGFHPRAANWTKRLQMSIDSQNSPNLILNFNSTAVPLTDNSAYMNI